VNAVGVWRQINQIKLGGSDRANLVSVLAWFQSVSRLSRLLSLLCDATPKKLSPKNHHHHQKAASNQR